MGITPFQRERRRHHLGSTDLATLLGVNPWATPRDLQLDKLGLLKDKPSNDIMDAGSRIEPAILQWAQDRLGKGKANQFRKAPGLPIGSHIDLILNEQQEPVEVKLSFAADYPGGPSWGSAGTDDVPAMVVTQCHGHMLCMQNAPSICYVPTFLGRRLFQMFHVERSQELIDLIVEIAPAWWQRHIVNQDPVTDSFLSLETLAILKRQPNKIKIVPPGLMATFVRLKRAQGVLKKRAEIAQQRLLEAAGDAEDIRDELGNRCTYLEQLTGKMDTKAFRAAHPELAARYTPEDKHRVLRQRKAEV